MRIPPSFLGETHGPNSHPAARSVSATKRASKPWPAAWPRPACEIFSTGGTRAFLEKLGIEVRDVAAYTGFPEMMEGRVKTLHPKVFGGILCRRDHADDMQSVAEHGMATFELVVVNLYPFEQTIAKPGVTPAEAIENIDIGGPSLVRAAAKNHAFVAIATQPDQYAAILAEIQAGGTSLPCGNSWPGKPTRIPPPTTPPSAGGFRVVHSLREWTKPDCLAREPCVPIPVRI